jgi:hypothetical protein
MAMVVWGCARGGVGSVREQAAGTAGTQWGKDSKALYAAQDRAAAEKLEQEIDLQVPAESGTLEGALQALGAKAGVTIVPKWDVLEAVGVERSEAMVLNLRRVAGSKALREVLNQGGGAKAALGYRIQEGRVEVRQKLHGRSSTPLRRSCSRTRGGRREGRWGAFGS